MDKYYKVSLLFWLSLIVALFCYASYLETVNEVREFPNEQVAIDWQQLEEMKNYHETNDTNLYFFD